MAWGLSSLIILIAANKAIAIKAMTIKSHLIIVFNFDIFLFSKSLRYYLKVDDNGLKCLRRHLSIKSMAYSNFFAFLRPI
jgi:hypothetical protein